MTRHSLLPTLCLLVPLLGGCDEKDAGSTGEESSTAAQKADQAQKVEALLRQNGIDPATLKDPSGASPAPAGGVPSPTAQDPAGSPPGAATGAGAQNGTQAQGAAPFKVTVESPGAQPHKLLAYRFTKGGAVKFSADMAVDTKRTVGGQPDASVPAVKISWAGTTETVDVAQNIASLRSTFSSITPATEGVPDFLKEQMLAEYAQLSGIQLASSVEANGHVLGMEVVQGALMNPQVIALMQNLQDSMAKGFLALPDVPVGVGAKWKAETTVEGQGLTGRETTTVTLTKVKGDQLSVTLEFSQTADPQHIDAPGLPPGAQIELLEMSGGGKGSMTVNLGTMESDHKLDLSMKVDTRITGLGTPAPVQSLTHADMKIHVRMSK